MAFWIQEGQRAKVGKVEVKEKFTVINLSTSRKDQKTGKYVYSDWGFSRFVGKAHEFAQHLSEGDVVVLKKAIITKEPYEQNGEKKWPKYATVIVFDAEIYRSNGGKAQASSTVTQPDDDTIPF